MPERIALGEATAIRAPVQTCAGALFRALNTQNRAIFATAEERKRHSDPIYRIDNAIAPKTGARPRE
jgi:hypothetical protein